MSTHVEPADLVKEKIIDCARDLILCWRLHADAYTHALALRGYVEQLETIEQNGKLEVFTVAS